MSDEPTLNNLLPLPWEARFQPAIPNEPLFRYDSWWIAHSVGDNGALIFQQVTELVDDTPETVEARARLWAKAPLLLEACITALMLGSWSDDPVDQEAYDLLRKAILEATGRDIIAEQLGEEAAIPWHCGDCGATCSCLPSLGW